MARKPKPVRLSPGELELMSMLWEEGPLSVAEAHERFGRYGKPIGYPTMQTRLNRLVEKGHVSRGDRRPARYEAAITSQQVSAGHFRQLLDAVGRHKLVPLVGHLIAERTLTAAEIEDLKKLLADAEKSATTKTDTGKAVAPKTQNDTRQGTGS
jgi:BlaI family transcriptional regulator, penicillinase repressor